MAIIAQIFTLVATVATAVMVVRAREAVRHTTLGPAWGWAVIAALAWCLAAAGSVVASPGIAGQLWYVASVLTLCPWIAVLGAQRPTVRVWNWFVVLPLLAVLLWPVALLWMPRGPDRLVLTTPQLIGFAPIVVMGLGNYLGTRFAMLAVLTGTAVAMLLSWLKTESLADPSALRATVPTLAVLLGVVTARSPVPQRPSGWESLWTDFRNTFGLVWANRIAERVNAEAAKAGWSVRLQPGGFVSAKPTEPADLTSNAGQIDHTLRWLLRRFVDEDWIAARLPVQAEPGLKEGGSLAGNDSIDASSTLS